MIRKATIALTALLGAMAVGCGGADARPHDDSLAQEFADASEFQREMYADGVITADEYQRSVFAMLGCMRERGIVIGQEPYPVPGQMLSYTWHSGATEDDRKRNDASYDFCSNEFRNTVLTAWVVQNAPDEATLQAARGALMKCLRDGGFDTALLSPNPVGPEWRPARSHPSWPDCQQRVTQEFDLWSFGG